MVGGNGLEGFITSGSPYSDTIIYQNMHFIMPNINARTCPDTSSELEQVKQSIVKCEDIVDNASYDDVYRFHPGGQLRINSERHRIKDYIRYTDYETAQVGVKYTDKNGTWENYFHLACRRRHGYKNRKIKQERARKYYALLR